MLFKIFDNDGSGQLSLTEFVEGCLKMVANAKHADVAYARFHLSGMLDEIKAKVYKMEGKADHLESIIMKVYDIVVAFD